MVLSLFGEFILRKELKPFKHTLVVNGIEVEENNKSAGAILAIGRGGRETTL